MTTELAEARHEQIAENADESVHDKLTAATPSAYDYPLLIKHLLHTPLRNAPDQEIVYRDVLRYDYRTLKTPF